jgi:hypothetical protein
MGPYCNFCDRRCFIPLPADTPAHIRAAYGGSGSMLVATCQSGQRFEREKVGYCLDDIRKATEAARLNSDLETREAF